MSISAVQQSQTAICVCMCIYIYILPMTNLDSILKSRDIILPTEVHIVKAVVFPVVMYSCESWTIKEGRMPKNWCLQTVVLEKTPESPLDSKEIKPLYLKGILLGRIDAEAETPLFWSFDANRQLIGKVPNAEKDWGQKEKRASGWDGWMALLMQWTWTWANSRRWWGTGVLQSMGWQSQTWLGDWTTTITYNGKESGENMYVYKYDESLAVYLK